MRKLLLTGNVSEQKKNAFFDSCMQAAWRLFHFSFSVNRVAYDVITSSSNQKTNFFLFFDEESEIYFLKDQCTNKI